MKKIFDGNRKFNYRNFVIKMKNNRDKNENFHYGDLLRKRERLVMKTKSLISKIPEKTLKNSFKKRNFHGGYFLK